MADPYREKESLENETAPSPEAVESQPEIAVMLTQEIPAIAEQESLSPAVAAPAMPERVADEKDFDFLRENLLSEEEQAIVREGIKILLDQAGKEGVDAANRAAKEYMEKHNAPYFLDVWQGFITRREIQEKYGIEQI